MNSPEQKPCHTILPVTNLPRTIRAVTTGLNIKAGCMVDERAVMEISPGSIRTHECEHCGNQAFTLDAVALNTEGVAYVGTIRRCYGCEGA